MIGTRFACGFLAAGMVAHGHRMRRRSRARDRQGGRGPGWSRVSRAPCRKELRSTDNGLASQTSGTRPAHHGMLITAAAICQSS